MHHKVLVTDHAHQPGHRDLPTIRAGVSSLRTSRLAPVYEEIAPSFAVFGTLFGKALQAQVARDHRSICVWNLPGCHLIEQHKDKLVLSSEPVATADICVHVLLP